MLTGQSGDLAPADGRLYALRDVTGTVQSIPLIASSVMSKKIAAGAQAIVLDVKTGTGAFMETVSEARQLAELMVSIGKLSGRLVVALLADMNQPLGRAVGNANEVCEAIDTLHGIGPADFREHCLTLSSYMLALGHKVQNLADGRKMAEQAIAEGRAWDAFHRLVAAQGGDVSFIDHPDKLPSARFETTIESPTNGWIKTLNARLVGETAVLLGAGRAKKGDPIDPAVGILVEAKVGDQVGEGQRIFTIQANSAQKLAQAKESLLQVIDISTHPVDPLPPFYGVIGELPPAF